jgi:ABC-type multidrug transport system fused ATPase/permease subunit
MEIMRLAIKGGVIRGSFFSFIIFCLFGAIVFIVWRGIVMTVNDEISAKDMLSFLFYTVFVAASIGGIAEQLAAIQRAIGATERVMDIIDSTPETIDLAYTKGESNKRIKGDIEFNDVSFFYPSRPEFQVLKNVSFKVNKGETVALVGPSGSGKSTIASMVLRFYDPQSGAITIDEKNVNDFGLTELRDNMAIVPQDVLLFGGTIKENIAYGKPNASITEILEAAQKANALEFIESFPQQFETIVGERGIQLSGGQRQRIAIARALLKNPSILILDEATSSLDSESERLVQEALEKLMAGRTSIVIAHRLSTIRKADRIIVIEKGKVLESGTHEELMQQESGLYRSLSKLQMDLA